MRNLGWLSLFLQHVSALRYDARYADFNLNQNETASDPMDYWGTWPDHEYHPSPENWRFPIYSLFLDRFANGDASNDDANDTLYETDVTYTNMRFGGDILGLLDSLDYIRGMGIRGIYLVGSIFINLPWMADSYSPLDLTLRDLHFGTISDWRHAIDGIHKRGMHIVLDSTFNTLGDLFEFAGTENTSTTHDPARSGCHDNGVSLDQRDPSHPIRNILEIMNKRREEIPILKDGWFLEQLSNQTRHEVLVGSPGLPTEFGVWSTVRDEFAPFQNLSASQASNEPVWLVYHNEADHTVYSQGCITSPFDHGAKVKNLLFYSSGNHVLDPREQQSWNGTANQAWDGEHVMVQYWSKIAGSSGVMQHADIEGVDAEPRLFPHLFAHGDFNLHGHDRSVASKVEFDGEWKYHFMGEWPDGFSLNVWGMNADGEQDLSFVYGDIDGDNILERWIPSTLSKVTIPFDRPPQYPYLAYEFALARDSYRYELRPKGNRWHQIILILLFALVPPASGIIGLWVYKRHYCRIILNRYGSIETPESASSRTLDNEASRFIQQRRVLIATVEYNIPDCNIDIRLGGLGTMSTLLGRHLTEYDLIWVVPCVSGVNYPLKNPDKPILASVCGRKAAVQVYYHKLGNVTYVMLDSPVFRSQTKAQPYPSRMDDMQSAIFYSVWNSCIAEAIRRFSPDVYHINDYHGALAPLHLLPSTVPCVLSLHNAEYQGLWSVRTPEEEAQVCAVFDISTEIMKQYVQFGTVFNLLHAATSYIRIHQNGIGVIGVSDVYSVRCMARYPILWSLGHVGSLPNPDPSQLDHRQEPPQQYEDKIELKMKTQEWANLERDPSAELFIFVGRMSKQKGTDLIADVFPEILEHNRKVQLVCIGPVVDLYGKFTAMKLEKVSAQFPRRVCCIPEFTQLPPFIFGGADFVLIPSRDEPYGLVAAQFGRKGALAVGAEVGGLGKVPGWWYTVECTTTRHLLTQFKSALLLGLQSTREERDQMRAMSLRQSFPISEWKAKLETLYHKVSSNQKVAHPSQRTRQSEKPILRKIKHQILSRKGFHLKPYFDDDSTVNLDDKIVAEDMWRETETVSMDDLLGSSDNCLNNVAATFTDNDGEFAAVFVNMLDHLTPGNSEKELCIQDFLIKSEREWFERIRNGQLGLPTESTSPVKWARSIWWPLKDKRSTGYNAIETIDSIDLEGDHPDLQVYRDNTCTVSRVQKFLSMKFHGYPAYTFMLTLGQVLSMNSFQLGILVGIVSQDESTLYTIGAIYAATSVVWWVLYQRLQTAQVVCLPFLLFGSSFLLLAAMLLGNSILASERLWQLAQVLYVCGSSSGSIYFAMNFIEEESSPIESWLQRASYISGFQYGYQALLWYSATRILRSIALSGQAATGHLAYWFSALAFLIGFCLMFIYGLLRAGLPSIYRRKPGHIPKFYSSLLRCPVPIHYLVSTFAQSFSLSAPLMAQSWLFFFSSRHVPDFISGLLVLAAILGFMRLARIAANHSVLHGHWILPVFSFTSSCIVHPRWAQIFWSAYMGIIERSTPILQQSTR